MESRHGGTTIPIDEMIIANLRAPNLGDMFSYSDILMREDQPSSLRLGGLFFKHVGAPRCAGRHPHIFEKYNKHLNIVV